jgi:4'-phosphopantetheinyl transferase
MEISENAIHIWTVRINSADELPGKVAAVLSPDEMARAARFRTEQLRRFFTAARATLRYLLGRYQGIDPKLVRFDYEPAGKPALAGESPLRFNLSHSGDVVVVAIGLKCILGVDVEQVHPVDHMEDIARRFFHPDEAAEVLSSPASQRERAFFSCWTRKEAYLKATGSGLSTPLQSFRVSIQPDAPPILIDETGRSDRWTLCSLSVAPGYAAALVYLGRDKNVIIQPVVDAAEIFCQPEWFHAAAQKEPSNPR